MRDPGVLRAHVAGPGGLAAANAALAAPAQPIGLHVGQAKASVRRGPMDILAMRRASRPTTPIPAASIRTPTSRVHRGRASVLVGGPAAARVPVARRAPAALVAVDARVAGAGHKAEIADNEQGADGALSFCCLPSGSIRAEVIRASTVDAEIASRAGKHVERRQHLNDCGTLHAKPMRSAQLGMSPACLPIHEFLRQAVRPA